MRSSRLLLIAGLLTGARPVLAGPLDDPHVGSMGFSGPTTGDLAAVYWNPAALGLIKGTQIMLGGGLRSTRVGVNPAGSDLTASGRGLEHPGAWPLGPTGFWGAGIEVAGRFAIGLAGYTPFSQKLKFDGSAGDAPTIRHHLINVAMRHHAMAAALAIQITDWLQVGVAPGLLLSYGHLVFDEESPTEESPTGVARYDLGTRGTQAPSYFVAAGIHYRHAAWDVGFSYTSAPLGSDGQVKMAMEQTRVTQLTDGSDLCSSLGYDQPCFSEMRYRLPEMFTAGVTWQATPRLAVTGMARWLRYGSHDDVDLRLVGPSGGAPNAAKPAQHLRLFRGFQDSWDWRARVVHSPVTWWRWSGTLRMETSAVPNDHVNAAAVDGFKIEPILATEFSLGRHLRLEAGYALEWMLPVTVDHSVFDPAAATACEQAKGDLAAPSCQARRAGQARPSAAGRYTMLRHTLALMATVSF